MSNDGYYKNMSNQYNLTYQNTSNWIPSTFTYDATTYAGTSVIPYSYPYTGYVAGGRGSSPGFISQYHNYQDIQTSCAKEVLKNSIKLALGSGMSMDDIQDILNSEIVEGLLDE